MSLVSLELADRIAAHVKSYGHVSFVEFERHFPEIVGTEQMTFCHPTVVLWQSLTGEFIETMAHLMTSKRVFMWPDPGSMVYILDGKWLTLPEAKTIRPYKKPRWLKVTFHHRAPTPQDFGMRLAA